MAIYTPKEVYLTKGKGFHKEKLVSFELALRDAGIAHLNIVTVSSIKPANAKVIRPSSKWNKDFGFIEAGAVVPTVLARQDTNINGTLVASAIGIAWPLSCPGHGYLSEHHALGQTEKEAGDYAEDLAVQMLATTMGVEFDPETSWDERKKVFKAGKKREWHFDSTSIVQSAKCIKGKWVTVVSAAVMC